ncbi:uncharacterized protein A4U43_C07F35650 [Asparagus officinalis]|uniref:Uncharacterized protein n=1 Tax=Asparagus officinalis TaxID=4686 RepID=A0A5P1EHN4_ASPOF|nr:uncharacterized protein A4U43_C07F35650 [Asparagus officinalis]
MWVREQTGCKSSLLSQRLTPSLSDSCSSPTATPSERKHSDPSDSAATSYTLEDNMLVRYFVNRTPSPPPSPSSEGGVFSEIPPRYPLSYCKESDETLTNGVEEGGGGGEGEAVPFDSTIEEIVADEDEEEAATPASRGRIFAGGNARDREGRGEEVRGASGPRRATVRGGGGKSERGRG